MSTIAAGMTATSQFTAPQLARLFARPWPGTHASSPGLFLRSLVAALPRVAMINPCCGADYHHQNHRQPNDARQRRCGEGPVNRVVQGLSASGRAGPLRDGCQVRRRDDGPGLARAADLFLLRRAAGGYGRQRDRAAVRRLIARVMVVGGLVLALSACSTTRVIDITTRVIDIICPPAGQCPNTRSGHGGGY